MAIKTYKPTTPGQRWKTASDFEELTSKKTAAPKYLLEPLPKKGGRNNAGRVTARHRGGGHKRKYRIIDFKRKKYGMKATVDSIQYDPNRSANIALLKYEDDEMRFIIAPNGVKVGDVLQSGSGSEQKPGNALPIKEISDGTFIHNIELTRGRGAQMARSAGTYAIVMAKDGEMAHLKLPSGEVRLVRSDCSATVGQVGNAIHSKISWGKAGRSRWLGWRPSSRAVVKNPVDHPMGGGEGRSSGGRHPCSKNGQSAKGLRTRKRSKVTNKYIIQRRKTK
ncbi:MAG: large subunit ribosomal protein L2 [Candidatus Omnitrophota bacterium]|jgi:large subunit ribosomal protein L2